MVMSLAQRDDWGADLQGRVIGGGMAMPRRYQNATVNGVAEYQSRAIVGRARVGGGFYVAEAGLDYLRRLEAEELGSASPRASGIVNDFATGVRQAVRDTMGI